VVEGVAEGVVEDVLEMLLADSVAVADGPPDAAELV
jgi:hypothetical protein